jgi:hypothetical protein
VVDFRDIIKEYMAFELRYSLYRRFPLGEIVETILRTSAYVDNGETLWNEVDYRFNGNLKEPLVPVDYDVLQMFFDDLTRALDEVMRRRLPFHIDPGEYVFLKWVDQTTVILQHDENARSCRSLLQTNNCQPQQFFSSSDI